MLKSGEERSDDYTDLIHITFSVPIRETGADTGLVGALEIEIESRLIISHVRIDELAGTLHKLNAA